MAQQQQQQQSEDHYLLSTCSGTIKPVDGFDPECDAQALKKAMKGIAYYSTGTDEEAIINILAKRSNDQRQEIIKTYHACFERNLEDDIKKELSGHFEDVIRALLMKPREYDVYSLHKAIKGPGTDESALAEILGTRSNLQLKQIKEMYRCKYEEELEKDIAGDTSGDFKTTLEYLLRACRDEACTVDLEVACSDAKLIHECNVEDIIRIMCLRNFMQLCATFAEFKKISCDKDIIDFYEEKFSGDFEMILKALVRISRNTPNYFTHSLHSSMKGLGTSDTRLIRIIVSRSEIDLVQIKIEYEGMYKKSLYDAIKSDTTGDYEKALLCIVHGN